MGADTGRVTALAVTPDGRFAVSGASRHRMDGSWEQSVDLWDLANGKQLGMLEGDSGEVVSVAVAADGRFVVSGGEDCTVRAWELDWEFDPDAAAPPPPSTTRPGTSSTAPGFFARLRSLFTGSQS